MELIYFILSCFGITQIITKGTIFNKLRKYGKFWGCPMCIGFWVGSILYLLNSYTSLFSYEYNILNFILLSSLSSGTSYVLGILFDDFGLKITEKQ